MVQALNRFEQYAWSYSELDHALLRRNNKQIINKKLSYTFWLIYKE